MLFSFIVDFMKSIKEIADELNVSKTAVRKKIANLGIGNQFAKIGNQFAINEEQEKLIKSAFLDVSQNKQSETKSETANRNGNQFAISEKELIEALREQIASQQKQIENQHEMIVKQQDSISRLTEALESTTRSLEASQALHAGTMQAQIEEKKERWKFWKRK